MNSFDNYDLSLRAINALKAAGLEDMDAVVRIVENESMEGLELRLGRYPRRTIVEITDLLIELGIYVEPKDPTDIYNPE